MRKYFLLGLLALAACNNSEPGAGNENAQSYPQQEIVELEFKDKVVYGVAVIDSSGVTTNRAYVIKLSLGDRVWQDTLVLELTRKQKVQGEVIFTEAVVDDMGGASVEVLPFEID